MSYQKPELKKMAANVQVNTYADDQSSCHGGHCVKAIYEHDRP